MQACALPGGGRGQGLRWAGWREDSLKSYFQAVAPFESPHLLIAIVSKACLDRTRGPLA